MAQEIYEKDNISAYKQCVAKLNKLFKLLHQEVCGPCIKYTKYGCCWGITENNESSKIDEIRKEIYASAKKKGKKLNGRCRYWEAKKGCILDVFKPPECAAIWCIAPSIQERYGIKYDSEKIYQALVNIELDVREENGMIHRGFDPESAKKLEEYISSMIDAVEKFQK